MLLIDYSSIKGEYFTDDAKLAACNLLHTYIDVQIQRLTNEYPGDGVQDITISKHDL